MCQHGLITKKGRSLYVNAFNASKYLFAIMIILLTRFLTIFLMSQFRYRTGICRWKTCRTFLTCLAS